MVGLRRHSSVENSKDTSLSFSASGIGISARTSEPFDPQAEESAPVLASPTPPRFELRTSRSAFVARRYRKAFRRGVAALVAGDPETALVHMEQSSDRGGADLASVQVFTAFCLLNLERLPEVASRLRGIVASHASLPDRLMHRDLSSGVLEIHVTPNITAHTGIDGGGIALLSVEVLQHVGNSREALELLERVGAQTKSAAVALCLADRYAGDKAWGEVDRVTEAFTSNLDDLSLQILVLRARAQRERGAFIPALTTLREALRFRKRDAILLNEARYERALLYESQGKRALARKDLERIFDHTPNFRDVAERLTASPLLLADYDLELLPSDAG